MRRVDERRTDGYGLNGLKNNDFNLIYNKKDMATTKKTKKTSEKTTKSTKTRKPRAKKSVVENVDAVVDEFLNETTVSVEEPVNEDPLAKVIDEQIVSDLREMANDYECTVEQSKEDPERELVEIISNNIAAEMNKEALDALAEGEAPDVDEIINSEVETVEPKAEEKPVKKSEKRKKRLTNRDVFGYDFMGVIYEY